MARSTLFASGSEDDSINRLQLAEDVAKSGDKELQALLSQIMMKHFSAQQEAKHQYQSLQSEQWLILINSLLLLKAEVDQPSAEFNQAVDKLKQLSSLPLPAQPSEKELLQSLDIDQLKKIFSDPKQPLRNLYENTKQLAKHLFAQANLSSEELSAVPLLNETLKSAVVAARSPIIKNCEAFAHQAQQLAQKVPAKRSYWLSNLGIVASTVGCLGALGMVAATFGIGAAAVASVLTAGGAIALLIGCAILYEVGVHLAKQKPTISNASGEKIQRTATVLQKLAHVTEGFKHPQVQAISAAAAHPVAPGPLPSTPSAS